MAARDPRVDAYLAPLPAWQRDLFLEMRDVLHEADPEIEETIKRSVQPYFVLHGNVAAFLAARDHVTVFLYDPLVDDPHGVITAGHGNSTGRQISLKQGETLNQPALLRMFRQIVEHNRAGGWRRLQRASAGQDV